MPLIGWENVFLLTSNCSSSLLISALASLRCSNSSCGRNKNIVLLWALINEQKTVSEISSSLYYICYYI